MSASSEVVADAAALLAASSLDPGTLVLPSRVVDEIRAGGRVHRRVETLIAAGARVLDPAEGSRERAVAAAGRSGDLGTLSATDLDVVALALERKAAVLTDDYAVQNVCHHLGLHVRGVLKPVATKRTWTRASCTGCGKELPLPAPAECPVCGAAVKRGRARRR